MSGWDVLDPVTKNSGDMAVHAALVPGGTRGRILYFGGYFVDDTHLFDAETMDVEPAPSLPGYNIFCSGHSFLADGRLLVAGGQLHLYDANGEIPPPVQPEEGEEPVEPAFPTPHLHYNMQWGGERRCSIYHPVAETWVPAGSLNLDPAGTPNSGGRWYPVSCALGSGEVIVGGGHPDLRESYPPQSPRHNNNTIERYNPSTNKWTLLASNPPAESQTTAAGQLEAYDYHRAHLLPTGLVFFSSPVREKNRFFAPHQGKFLEDGAHVIDLPPVTGPDDLDGLYHGVSAAFTSTLLPLLHEDGYRPRVLLMGAEKAKLIDLGDPANAQWQNTAKRDWAGTPPPRYFVTSVLLPTGQVFFAGGTQANEKGEDPQALCVLEGEIYDPANGSWQTTEPASVPRHYHGVAILMPNGAVWTAGSNGPTDAAINPGGRELRIELYRPWYFDEPRPVVTKCPPNIGWGYPFRVEVDDASAVDRVVLLRCGSVTHGFNFDQRYVTVPFEIVDDTTIEVQTPYQPDVLPPGRYLLFTLDGEKRPCEWAPQIRISKQKAYITADISTYSSQEVAALGTPALFENALYLVYDGFLPGEVTTPTFTIRWKDTNDEVAGISAILGSPQYEAGVGAKDTAQRIAYPVDITFESDDAFDDVPEDAGLRDVVFRAELRDFPSDVTLTLSLKLNPRMRDGNPHWLSIDLRAFSTGPGQEAFTAGIPHPSGAGAPYDYITDVLDTYNAWTPAQGEHPFDELPTSQEGNPLPLYSTEDGWPVFNYAIARVRLRAPEEVKALNVRVFFRLWTTGWTGLVYSTSGGSYPRHGNGASAAPLLGLSGGEVNTIPCFAEPRQANMEEQQDPANLALEIAGKGATEVHRYFGCWLDFNQDVARFPLEPEGNGPFEGELLSIQELMRGLHQCLVAEIHYWPEDPIQNGATPASSDNLAQRNLLLDDSENPGGFGSHLVHNTFEVKPSPFSFPVGQATAPPTDAPGRRHPDELVVHWGNLPRDSHVTFYLPQVDVDAVIRYAAERGGPGNLAKAGDHTISCKVTDVGYIPVPGPFTATFAGLMSVQLPPTVTKGDMYRVVLRQVDGRKLRVVGTTQFDIRVKTGPEIVPRLEKNLSVLKHIALSIPEGNRWYPVFERYLGELGDRVRALGGDPDEIDPSPTGSGRPEEPRPERPGRAGHSGKVRELAYDCDGAFEGFVLDDCGRSRFFAGCEPSLEDVVRRACRDRSKVTVYPREDDQRKVNRLVVHCC